jgi:asparagine synthase (glutamine-hydrolysing)
MWHYDEPVHSPTALIGFQLMKLAKSRGVTVVLNGQGADEVNAGYHAYFRAHWTDLLHEGRWSTAFGEVKEYSRSQQQPYWPALRSSLNHWLRTELARMPGFDSVREPLASKPPLSAPWFQPEFEKKIPGIDRAAWTLPLSGVLARSVEVRPLPLYLRVEDRNSMAHSVEARLPFLDYRLVSLAFSLPGEWKLRGGWNKYVVREAMKGVIAENVRTRRDKMGFPTPSKDWWGGPWFEPMMDLLDSAPLRDAGVCDTGAVRNELERHRNGAVDVAAPLFRLAEFATWLDLRVPSAAARPDRMPHAGTLPAPTMTVSAAMAGSSHGDRHV